MLRTMDVNIFLEKNKFIGSFETLLHKHRQEVWWASVCVLKQGPHPFPEETVNVSGAQGTEVD